MDYKINRLLYFIAFKAVGIPVKLRLNLETAENAAFFGGPAVILANHESNVDWMVTAYLLKNKKVRFVVGRYHFRKPLTNMLFLMLGCIPKEQFHSDPQAIKMIMKAIKEKNTVVLFPSGQSSYSGESTYIVYETAKLLKRLAVPVYYVRIDGTHLAFPKWDMRKIRKHKISATFNSLFCPEELSASDEPEIYEKICEALYFDDYELQRKQMIAAGVRTVTGLDSILYMCPICKTEFMTNADENMLSCKNCGLVVCMDTYGFLSSENPDFNFDTPTKWYRWQFCETVRQCEGRSGCVFETGSKLEILNIKGKIIESHEGRLSFDAGLLVFSKPESDMPIFSRDVNKNPVLFQHESTDYFELPDRDRIYRFIPAPKGAASKFVILKELQYYNEKRDSTGDPVVKKVFDKLINK
ncbi:MAG: 1-acyl-sn-glycerol-3-phosphate acyltransferase [Oscillospiraceae bacterium]|nr:1-acyl-sn-glycerol-3-phosphate acyltransferase [Oscillospiraceae bacterium]